VGQPVTAVGFALDASDLHWTTGAVTSSMGAHVAGFISHSASIASGNSGGPCVSADGRLAGLNTATMVESDSISLAVPLWCIRAAIAQNPEAAAAGGVLRPVTLGMATRPPQPFDGSPLGVRVTRVFDTCSVAGIRMGDHVTHVGDVAVGPMGRLVAPGGTASTCFSILLDPDDGRGDADVQGALTVLALASPTTGTLAIRVRRGVHNLKLELDVSQAVLPDRGLAVARRYPFHEHMYSLRLGGVVLQPLTVGLLEAFDVDGQTRQERDVLACVDAALASNRGYQAVVVSHVALTSCLHDHVEVLDRLVSVDGHPVHTLADVVAAAAIGGTGTASTGRRHSKRHRRKLTLEWAVDGPLECDRGVLAIESMPIPRSTSAARVGGATMISL